MVRSATGAIEKGMLIRDVARPDFAAIAPIYAHYVLHSAATFELTPPSEEEMAQRAEGVARLGLPFLVAEDDGEILGYAYAAPYRPRPAYRFTVEESVYAAPEAGLGARCSRRSCSAAPRPASGRRSRSSRTPGIPRRSACTSAAGSGRSGR